MSKLAFWALLPLFLHFFIPITSQAQSTKNYAVTMHAAIQENPAQISVFYDSDPYTVSYTLYRKLASDINWGAPLASLSLADSVYLDTTVSSGTSYEYRIVKQGQAGATSFTGYGYINAGIKIPAIEDRGAIALLIDSSHRIALDAAIRRLETDLRGDGWRVYQYIVAPTATVPAVKALLASFYNGNPQQNKTVFLLGNLPVPYAGQIYPDGHANHEGAWPADPFYADMDGIWTDSLVNVAVTFDTRHHNVPGDGKFDQSLFVDLELEIGRLDLSNLPSFPTSEVELLRNYLDKNHRFRTKKVSIEQQAVIDDNFTNYAEAFAANGYRNFPTFFGPDKVFDSDYVTSLKNDSYLWSYGCGAGTHTSCSGVANTNTFVNDSLGSVFTMLFGSYFGDWDRNDNFLRAALASGSTLTNCWGGRPNYYFHHMALGKHIGFSSLLSQNNTTAYHAGYCGQWVHSALMGDPTLRMHMVAPISDLHADTIQQHVVLQWSASPDSVLGYYVYRKSLQDSVFLRMSNSWQVDTIFRDSCLESGAYEYMVRAVVLEQNASGSYYNMSCGLFDTVVVFQPIPTADFSYVIVDSAVNFTNNSNDAAQYFWDFGDSSFSSVANPQHQYSQNGMYNVQLIAIDACNADTTFQTIQIAVFTNTLQVGEQQLNIYPNPATDFLQIEMNQCNVPMHFLVYDNLGECIDIQSVKSPNFTISTQHYTPGIYTVRIVQENDTVEFKFVKA